MKSTQVNLRLEPELIRNLEAAASAESLERGTMMRKLLLEGLSAWKLEHALRRYQSGEISIGRACEESGRSHWEVIELRQARGIAYRIDIDDSIERGREFMARRRERVAEASPAYSGAASSGGSAAPAGRVRPGARRIARFRPAPRHGRGSHPAGLSPRPGGVLVVGINPPPPSVNRGHYYQGKLGRRLWKRLEHLGLLTGAIPGHEDEALVAAGHGLTDLLRRVTARSDELDPKELRAGGEALQARVREWRPGLVLFVFKEAAVHALGSKDVTPGLCGEIAGVKAFLLSGPFASAAVTKRVDEALRRVLAGL